MGKPKGQRAVNEAPGASVPSASESPVASPSKPDVPPWMDAAKSTAFKKVLAYLTEKARLRVGSNQWATASFEEAKLVEPNLSAVVMESIDWLRRLKYLRPVLATPGTFQIDPSIVGFDPTMTVSPKGGLGQDVAHSPDFRSVNWCGSTYTFTGTQAACIRILWQSFEIGCADVSDLAVLDGAASGSERLPLVFRDHPAWGTMIVAGATKGTHRLSQPTS
jgi:hypothetical protein